MQDPVRDVAGVVKGVVHARNATAQRDCLEKFWAPDASFDHLMVSISSNSNVSRMRNVSIFERAHKDYGTTTV